MRKIITIISLMAVITAFAQSEDRLISGRLTDSSGLPIPGVNIVIKGTDIGTVTNTDGGYSIKVPLGATLVFSSIGMTTKEVLVTERNSTSSMKEEVTASTSNVSKSTVAKQAPDNLVTKVEMQDVKGEATLTSNTPSFVTDIESTYSINYHYARKIDIWPVMIRAVQFKNSKWGLKKYGAFGKNGVYILRQDNTGAYGRLLTTMISTYVGIDVINKVPKLQNTFSQGQQNVWQGSDQQQLFSWGPPISSLEYDGSDYQFDKNGKLVVLGQGDGTPSNVYNPTSFFKNGIKSGIQLDIGIPIQSYSDLIFSVGHHNESGVIPNSDTRKNSFSIRANKIEIGNRVSSDFFISYSGADGNLLSRGSNFASIVGSVFRTPPTFDNANGYSSKQALKNSGTYVLPDGTQRSHAYNVVDNPYWLVNQLPDQESMDHFNTHINLRYDVVDWFRLSFSTSLDKQWSDLINGMPPSSASFPSGRLTKRNEEGSVFTTFLSPRFNFGIDNSKFEIESSYHFSDNQRGLYREDGLGFSDAYEMSAADHYELIDQSLNRKTHELISSIEYKYNSWLTLKALSRHYFSNTISSSSYHNFLPTASIRLDVLDLIDKYGSYFISSLSVYSNYGLTLHEAPLIYGKWNYNSVSVDPSAYGTYYESNEIFFSKAIAPEQFKKFEAGLNSSLLQNRVGLAYNYYQNITDNFITPVQVNDKFMLSNVARIITSGHEATASYNNYYNSVRWGIDVTWTKINPLVDDVYSDEVIPLSGFSTVRTVLAEGKPVGAIYGSTYRRNETGQMIIGSDGFPMVDNELKMIGNPNPDWTMGVRGKLNVKHFYFSMLFDVRHGGQVWNGTSQALNYFGMSKDTGEQRLISNYIFSGVTEEGDPNTLFVDFANPSKPLEENRWVRYGFESVGEEGIEQANWVRLSELKTSYRFRVQKSASVQAEVSLIGRNLFLFTPYSGVDPTSSLFNYTAAQGLDLFNAPNTRSYMAQLTVKF